MARFFLILSSVFGFLSVALGAFAAHGLKSKLDPYFMGVFQTAVQYQFYHTVALALVGLLLLKYPDHFFLKLSGHAFWIGTLIFSGSLYALALTEIKILGAITPIGGMGFLAGWSFLFWFFLKGM